HVGHAIPLQRLAAFQREGHKGVLIVGDYTTRIGDPSGRSAERPVLSDEEIDRNANTYLGQAALIVDTSPEKLEVRFNGEWLAKLDFAEILRLTRTTTLLLGWDGEKMSASKGNYIGLSEPPEEQFGKAMRISDELLPEYYRLVIESDVDPTALDPLEAKLELARFIVRRSHGDEGAEDAEQHFTRVVREGKAPDEAEIPEVGVDGGDVYLPELLKAQFGQSNSHWRRVIEQGGVRIDGAPVTELELPAERLAGAVIQAGKRQFLRVSG